MSKSTKSKKAKLPRATQKHESQANKTEGLASEQIDNETLEQDQSGHKFTSETSEDTAPIRVEFPYSDVVRSYVPEAMAIADKALGDWKTEGSFMNLGIENPYANMAVSLSLQNAKKIEKKLEEKGVLPVVRMGFEVLKSKVQKQK